MPRFDGTGPDGTGPRTGGIQGNCQADQNKGGRRGNGGGRGQGRCARQGTGGGGGRGQRQGHRQPDDDKSFKPDEVPQTNNQRERNR